MDGVLADFWGGIGRQRKPNEWDPPEMFMPGFYRNLPLMPGAKEGLNALIANPGLDVFIASKPTTKNLHSATEKFEWIADRFPSLLKKIFLTCDKGHLIGDYLIDDDKDRWAHLFPGEFIHFDENNSIVAWDRIVRYMERYRP